MDLSKLTKGHVFVIGLVVALLLAVAFYFLGPAKTRQNLTTYNTQLAAHQQIIGTEAQKKQDLADAKKEVREKQALWATVENRRMPQPPIDLSKPDEQSQTKAMIRLWQEPAKTVPMIERFALNTKDVIVTTNFGVGGQPTDPRAIPQSVIEWPLGTVTVQGTFPNILKYMKRWNQAGRLVAIDNFQLQGTSPFLTGTANVTVYIFPKPNPQARQQQPGYGGYGGGPGGPYDPALGGDPGAYGPGGGPPPGAFGPGGPGYDPAMAPGGAPGVPPGPTG
jgi:hypothetical protein